MRDSIAASIVASIFDDTRTGIQTVLIGVGIVIVILTVPLWGPFWLLGYCHRLNRT